MTPPRWSRPRPQVPPLAGLPGVASNELWSKALTMMRRYRPYWLDTLYHYTSLQGLAGIFSSRELWLSNTRFMNDASELSYGRDQLLTACGRLEERRNPGPRFKHLLASLRDAQRIDARDAYVFCFCEEGDLLSQWRGYGDAGSGVAIGFNIQKLAETAAVPVAIEPIAYANYLQKEILLHFVKTYRKYVNRVPNRASSALGGVIQQAQRDLAWLLPLLKSTAFEEEKEWRLLRLSPKGPVDDPELPKVSHRVSNGLLVPYIRVPLNGKLPVTRIVIGPSSHRESIRDGVLDLLAWNDLANVQVDHSETPYRSR